MYLNVVLSFIIASFVYEATADANTTEPVVQRYTVRDASGVNCIMLEAGIRLHFNYSVTTKKNESLSYDVPSGTNLTSQGSCGNHSQSLVLEFDDAKLTFTFNKTGANKKNVALVTVEAIFSSNMLPDAEPNKTFTVKAVNLTHYECPVGKGFLCNSNTSISFKQSTPLVSVDTIDLRAEAFRTDNVTYFNSDYTQCAEDNRVSNIIPIAVGAALGALVLVVLIAYLVGRKRNRGYETV